MADPKVEALRALLHRKTGGISPPKAPSQRANPPAYEDAFVEKVLLEGARQGLPTRICYQKMGISRAQWYRWEQAAFTDSRSTAAAFFRRFHAAQADALAGLIGDIRAAAEGALDKNGILKRDWQAAAFLLKNLDPASFGDRKQVDIAQTTVVAHTRMDPRKLSDEDFEKMHEIANKARLLSSGDAEEEPPAIDVDFSPRQP